MDLDRFAVVAQRANECARRHPTSSMRCNECCYDDYGFRDRPLRPASATSFSQQLCVQQCTAVATDHARYLLERIASETASLADSQAALALLAPDGARPAGHTR